MERPDDELRQRLCKGFSGRVPPEDRRERLLREARRLRGGPYRTAVQGALRRMRGRQKSESR